MNTAIRRGTAVGFRLFQDITSLLESTGSGFGSLADGDALSDEFGRFRVWSGNLGALQKGHSSLDYRLRDSPLLLRNALKLLKELEDNISEAISIISGARLPYEQQVKPDENEDDEDGFYSEDDDNSDAGAPKTELEQRFSEIVDIIDNLYKLSVRIRTPTVRTRSIKAASYRPKDPETGIDILDQYAHFDLEHTRDLIRCLRMPHVDLDSVVHAGLQTTDSQVETHHFLIERLSAAITLRRRQFKYWRRHRDKLGSSSVEDIVQVSQPVERPDIPRQDTQDTMDAQPEFPIVATLKTAPTEKTGKTLLSGTEATHHHQSLDEIVDSRSVTSYATTVHDLTGRGVELPLPPKAADGDKDFECPYCYIICPARYGRGRSWRTHILQDLQPYVCTYNDCVCSEQLFRSRREWSDHEASHRKVWRCLEHPSAVFPSRDGLENHLRQLHPDIPEDQLDSIVAVGETSTIDLRPKCPICLANDAEIEGGLQNHLANHLERLASFALPKDVDTADDESDGGSSAASQGSSQGLSEISFPTTAQSEEEVADSELSSPKLESHELLPGSSLSAAMVEGLPDASQDRLGILLPSENILNPEPDAVDERETEELDESFGEVQAFRSYLHSLPGALSVRLSRRDGLWAYVNFKDESIAAEAMNLFDKTLFPKVNIRPGSTNSASLWFSLPATEKPLDTRELQEDDASDSSMYLSYDEGSDTGRMPILPATEIPTLRSLYRNRKLQQHDQSYAPNDSYNQLVSFIFYDITRLRVGAIINSANRAMKITRSIDSLNYAIHKAAGPGLERECKSIGRVKIGQVRMTSAHNLPSTYIIHAARPQYAGSTKGKGQVNLLTECYRGAFKTARENNIRTLAFPCLAAGGCGFPSRVAARIALQEVREFLDVYKSNPFERIIFCVFSETDEKAYRDLLPVFFPPTHDDVENLAPPLELRRDPTVLATQLQETYTQLEAVTQDLNTFSENFSEFPRSIFNQLENIAKSLHALRDEVISPTEFSSRSVEDIDLICSVLQGACESLTELAEETKSTDKFDVPHKTIWDKYNFHKRNNLGLDVNALLELCQDFVQSLDESLNRGGKEAYEMGTMRVRLGGVRLKQTGESQKEVEDMFAEAMYTREFQSQAAVPSRTDTIRVTQIPSLSRLYQLDVLGTRSTDAVPNSRFNQTVCMIREDITRLEVDILVNSTDMGFSGMGTLDRTVFRKGGLPMHEDCANFGVCNEGDVKLTAGYMLPARHVLHTIPPETYRSNTKDVLRKLYKVVLKMASQLKATSIAIPTIGTGMLNYPRRDCASLAMEEVKLFLEAAGETSTIEKIVFCVFGSSDEFIYKSLLPVFFPPVDLNVNKALPSDERPSSRAQEGKATSSSPPPKRTIFNTIGDAFRNVRFGRQPVTETSRPLNDIEEHALMRFESHARGCSTCSDIANLYAENRELCADGYREAQDVLQYLYMESDQSAYSRNIEVENDRRIKLEIPQDYPNSLNLLATVEKSYRDSHRSRPFVVTNKQHSLWSQSVGSERPLPTEGRVQQAQGTASTTKEPEKAIASVYTWSDYSNNWERLQPYECSMLIHLGRVDIFETEFQTDRQVPLLSLELTDSVPVQKQMSVEVALKAPNLQEPRSNHWRNVMFRSRSPAESATLYLRLRQARTNAPQPPPRRHPATAAAHVFSKTGDDEDWKALFPYICKVYIYLGRLELYENDTAETENSPLAAFELSPLVDHKQDTIDVVFAAQPLPESRINSKGKILLRCNNLEACNDLYEFIVWGCANNPKYLTHKKVEAPHISAKDTTARDIRLSDVTLQASSASNTDPGPKSNLTQQLRESGLDRPIATVKSSVSTWDDATQSWYLLYASDCIVKAYQSGRVEVYEDDLHGGGEIGPLIALDASMLSFTKYPLEIFTRDSTDEEARVQAQAGVSFKMRSVEDCNELHNAMALTQQLRGRNLQNLTSSLEQLSLLQTNPPERPASAEPGPVQRRSEPSQLDLAISGLSNVNIEGYFSYLDLAAESGSSKTKIAEQSSLSKRSITLPPHPTDFSTYRSTQAEDSDSEDDGIRHPRPTSPDQSHEQGKHIPPGARWTKINRRLVDRKALIEADEKFEEREDSVVVLRVLTREEIVKLAERTRQIRTYWEDVGEVEKGGWGRDLSRIMKEK
ncbi:hypothetical protein EJ04DRAFT_573686 [Polyplosphaeria fusca]|uniref:Macro domain-containing protein n=1 Tax=Polyplosphaeria fusca TaxID=682080 RepID=A0A9P4V586_9PLEO|nr:hypothetical protein EJ04DRAFT_573686 [Polyplosphaeria fusca]